MAPSKARPGLLLLGVACGLAISPAASAAPTDGGPLREVVRAAAPAIAPAAEQLRQAVRTTTANAQRTVPIGAPVRTLVERARGPVSSALARVSRSPELVRGAQAAVTDLSRTQMAPSDRAAKRGPAAAGAIDRNAAVRRGAFAGSAVAQSATSNLVPPFSALARSTTGRGHGPSSTTAHSDRDAPDLDLPPGPFGTGGLSGPTGIALLAFAALLVGLLALAPPFASRMLQLSPSRWGPAAFLSPIERPG
jgi:hypothetical protein